MVRRSSSISNSSLLLFAGTGFAHDFDALRKHSQGRLVFQWPLLMRFSNETRMKGIFIRIGGRPVLWFTKGRRRNQRMVPTIINGVRFVASLIVGAAVLGAITVWIVKTPPTPAPTNVVSTISRDRERGLKPKDTFKECSNCPQMIVVPAGFFTMGSPASGEGPQHRVTFARPFAVGQFALTFEEWDTCVADGGCNGYKPSDQRWGRGRQPVINVSWDDAKGYVAWLSKKTGKPYRLLTDAEYEYAARAGTQTAYPWGNEIGKNNANCVGCGSQWDGKQTAPVGSFPPNGFGLYDMVGNVWQWTEDCYHEDSDSVPTDGSAWTTGDCGDRVVRGGSWSDVPGDLRSARRVWDSTDDRSRYWGFPGGADALTSLILTFLPLGSRGEAPGRIF
jgi:formylglycine-generating enzyme required for sulfatase activity